VVAIFPPPASCKWGYLSFVSTLYLQPIVDDLLVKVPELWQAEVRLGLQEALVNAAKHGNRLDPTKMVSVRFACQGSTYWWVITDQGTGFSYPHSCIPIDDADCTCSQQDCGRGLYILYQVFDHVNWHDNGRELHLRKRLAHSRLPLIR